MKYSIKTLALLTAFVPSILAAETECTERTALVEKLEASYSETFAGGGLQNANQIFEIWASDKTDTWTILLTRADGISCVIAHGTNWREAQPGQPKTGTKS